MSDSAGSASPSSRHLGGAHILMGDGAIVFMTDSIDAGDGHAPTVYRGNPIHPPGWSSPYGLWGALGTRANKEPIKDALNQ